MTSNGIYVRANSKRRMGEYVYIPQKKCKLFVEKSNKRYLSEYVSLPQKRRRKTKKNRIGESLLEHYFGGKKVSRGIGYILNHYLDMRKGFSLIYET